MDAERSGKPLLTWPIGVQIALGFLITAGLFFVLGRWSHAGMSIAPAATTDERTGPALNLNLATRAELRLIPGIGDALSQRIIDYRERHGDFRSIEELRKVSGVGPKTLERIRPHLYVIPEDSYVSANEEETAAPEPRPRRPSSTPSVSKKAAELKGTINVNRASQTELQKLPGIGPKLSQRILDERTKGLFKSVEDLRRVPGIGPKTLEKLRPHVTIAGS